MTTFKRLTALLLALCLLLPTFAFAQEDEEILIEDVLLTEDGEEIPDDATEEEAYIIDSEQESFLESLDPSDLDTSINPDDLEMNPNLPENVVNILLVGVDTRSTDLNEGMQRGDVQLILSINKDTGDIGLTSIMRDLYVTIPGYKSKQRINVAYARGGGQLAMRTVNRMLEMNIQHYAVINFYGLASIIDAIGGIDVDMTKQEAGAINTYLRKHPPKYDNTDGKSRVALEKVTGVQHLDGVQAVMYARVRSIDNDFERTARQRHLLELLLKKIMQDMTLEKMLELMQACLPYVKTNMSAQDMFSLAMSVLSSGIVSKAQTGESLLEQFRVPMDETWKYSQTDNGDSVVAFRNGKQQTNIEAVHEQIYGSYYPAQ